MFRVSKKILSAAVLLPAMLWADRVEQNFGGIGVQIFNNGKFPQVAMVIPGTPADAAGLLPGDRIESSDGRSLEGLTSDQATEAMRGEAGREIVLSVRRGDELLEVKAVRVNLAVKMESCGELREKRSGELKGSDVRSALNAGQVGAFRAAEYIAAVGETPLPCDFEAALREAECENQVTRAGEGPVLGRKERE